MGQSCWPDERNIYALKRNQLVSRTNEAGQITGIIDNKGAAWRPNDAVTWVDFQEELERTRIKTIWETASAHRGGGNLKEGADISIAQSHYKNLVHAGKHAEAGALMTMCRGLLVPSKIAGGRNHHSRGSSVPIMRAPTGR